MPPLMPLRNRMQIKSLGLEAGPPPRHPHAKYVSIQYLIFEHMNPVGVPRLGYPLLIVHSDRASYRFFVFPFWYEAQQLDCRLPVSGPDSDS